MFLEGALPLRFADPEVFDQGNRLPVQHPSTCSGVKDKPLRGAFGILDPFRAFREAIRRRRDEERPFPLRTKNMVANHSGCDAITNATYYVLGLATMALIGLTEASKLTGKDKTTIHRAMKSGRLSFTLGDDGDRQIDPAELERVFPIKPQDGELEVAPRNRKKAGSNHAQIAQLTAQLEIERTKTAGLAERLADKDGVIDDLRQRLDREGEERRQAQARLTALLTDQRPKVSPPDVITMPPSPTPAGPTAQQDSSTGSSAPPAAASVQPVATAAEGEAAPRRVSPSPVPTDAPAETVASVPAKEMGWLRRMMGGK